MPPTSTMPTNFRSYVLTTGRNLTTPELAELFQVAHPTILHWMGRVGIPAYSRPRKNGVDKLEIRKLVLEGRRTGEIIRELKCSDTTVRKVRREIRAERMSGLPTF